VLVTAIALPTVARADQPKGLAAASYGIAGAELGLVGAIAIHELTPSTPGKGVGLAVNFLPVVVGIGTGVMGETLDLDARPPLGMHGAVIGALPLMAFGAAFDGRDATSGARFGVASVTLGVLGAAGGAYLGATRIETTTEAVATIVAPFVGAFGGALTFAVVHFFDDEGPSSTGRLLRYAGAGMLLGTVGSMIYAFPDRGESSSMMASPLVTRTHDTTVLSVGGVF